MKKFLAFVLVFVMALSLMPTVAFAADDATLPTAYGTFSYQDPDLLTDRTLTLNFYVNEVFAASHTLNNVRGTGSTATFTAASGYHISRVSTANGSWDNGQALGSNTMHKGVLTRTGDPWSIDIYLSTPFTVTVNYAYTDNSPSNSEIQTLTSYTKTVFYGEKFKSNEWNYYDAANARNCYIGTVKNETSGNGVEVKGTGVLGYYFEETITGDTTYTVTLDANNKSDFLAVDAYLYRGGNALGFDDFMGTTFRYSGYDVTDKNGNNLVYILKDGALQGASAINSIGDPTIIVKDNIQYKYYFTGIGVNLGHVKDVYYNAKDQNWYYVYRWETNLDLIDVSWTNTVGPISIPQSEEGRINFVYKEFASDHKLIYDANGGTGAPATQTQNTSQYSVNFTVSNGEPTRENYVFKGWAETADATTATIKAGDTVAVTGTKTIYAVWEVEQKDLSYTVKYVLDSESGTVLDEDEFTVQVPATDPTYQLSSVEEKTFTGYKLKTAPTLPKTVSNGDIIYVIYEKDESQTKRLTYKVVYVLDNAEETVLDAGYSNTVEIWVNDNSYTVSSVTEKSFEGCEFKGYAPTLPASVANNDTIKVIYSEKEPVTTTIEYTVKYVDGAGNELAAAEQKTATVLEADPKYTVKANDVTIKTITGYKTDMTAAGFEGSVVEDGDELAVVYEKDPKQTKKLKYSVKYVVDSTTGTVLATKEEEVDIWVNDDSYVVNDYEAKSFTGYKLKTAPALPATVREGGILYAIYQIDPEQTKELHFQVKYWLESTEGTLLKTEDVTVDIQVLENSYTISSIDINVPNQYVLKSQDELPKTVEEGGVYNVICAPEKEVKALTYYVKYVIGGPTGAELSSVEISVLVPFAATEYEVLEIEEKSFVGFALTSAPTLPTKVKEGDVLYVIYDESVGNLTISKAVTGDKADKNKYFSFTLEIDANDEYAYSGSKSGYAYNGCVIQLKHGESITISGLPAGAAYSVTESDNKGYKVYASGDEGVIVADKTVKAAFTNSKSSVPGTGDDSNTALWMGIMVASFLGMAGALLPENKKRGKHSR